MVRGFKKKLLIGLLSATVVGTSLAPNVPLVGSFAQEVKANGDTGTGGSEGGNNQQTEPAYKYTAVTVTPVAATYKWPDDVVEKYVKNGDEYTKITNENINGLLGNPTKDSTATVYESDTDGENNPPIEVRQEAATYKWPESVVGKYVKNGNEYTEIKGDNINQLLGNPAGTISADSVTVYTREVDDTKSKVTVTKSQDTKAEVTPKTIGSTNGGVAAIDKNKETKVTVEVKASVGKTIKDVVAKVLDGAGVHVLQDNIKATKVANADDLYEFVITATENTVNVVVNATEDKLLITPTLNTANLSSKVGTATLTSSDPVGTDGEFELKVTLEDGVTIEKSKLTVTAGDGATVKKTDEKNGVVTYKITPSNVTTDKLEIKVSGRLDNDGLDTKKEDKGSSAEVKPNGNVAADANNVLDVAKSNADKKYVKAFLEIEAKDSVTGPLADEVNAITTVDKTMEIAGYIAIDLYRIENDDSSEIENASETDVKQPENKQTTLGSLLTVHYVLPDKAQGKILSGYKVISIHDGKREITTTPNADGEYLEVNGNTLTLHVKKLSDFAVLYSTKDATTPEPEPIVPDDDKKDEDKKDTPVTPNPTVKPADTKAATSTKAAKVTTSTKKSTKTSSPKTADYAVNSLLALLTGAAGLFGITLVNKKRKEDEE